MVHTILHRIFERGKIDPVTGKTLAQLEAEQKFTPQQLEAKRIVAAGAALTIASLPFGGAAAIGRLLFPKTLLGLGVRGLAAGTLVASPELRKVAVKTPEFVVERGLEIGEEVERRKREEGKVPTTIAAGVIGAGLGLLAPKVFAKAKEKVKEKVVGIPSIPPTVTLPETITQPKPITAVKKRRRRALQPFRQTITQSVRVQVLQRQSAHRKTVRIKNISSF